MRRHLVAMGVAVFTIGGVFYVAAQAATASHQDVFLTQDSTGSTPSAAERPRNGLRPVLRSAIRGELVVPGAEEGSFRSVKIDRGILERLDGSNLVIKEDDGQTVEVPTAESTRIMRDRQQVEISALKAGDHVFTLRMDEGEGFVTKGVRAFSPERWAELQKRREECRAHRTACRAQRMQRRGGAVPEAAA